MGAKQQVTCTRARTEGSYSATSPCLHFQREVGVEREGAGGGGRPGGASVQSPKLLTKH